MLVATAAIPGKAALNPPEAPSLATVTASEIKLESNLELFETSAVSLIQVENLEEAAVPIPKRSEAEESEPLENPLPRTDTDADPVVGKLAILPPPSKLATEMIDGESKVTTAEAVPRPIVRW